MIKIDGKEIPSPSDYLVSIMDISTNAERNAAGDLVMDRVATKRKIELSWRFLPKDELSTLLKSVSSVFFEVEYIDPQEGTFKSGTFYCGDRSAGALDYINGNIRYRDIKFNLIER
ncbi:DUF6711 family protein [Tissierella sp. Yu-01]|uniref:DUF6711 family protein n=1 Tax=Tissierella sp. Yu-01 TaxID=3035694 RepID=UPI00240E02EA|nr:DUF6711 family protein [Tissierella sp. Yu-01]WFA10327.1 hypothetical protein P3962_07185 [Tissierella sp. Yu-01]